MRPFLLFLSFLGAAICQLTDANPPISAQSTNDRGTLMALYYHRATGDIGIHVVNPFGYESKVAVFPRSANYQFALGVYAFDRKASIFYAVRRTPELPNQAEIFGIDVRTTDGRVVRWCKTVTAPAVLTWTGSIDVLLAVYAKVGTPSSDGYYVSALKVNAYSGPYDNVVTGRPAQWVPPFTSTVPPPCSFAAASTEDFPATTRYAQIPPVLLTGEKSLTRAAFVGEAIAFPATDHVLPGLAAYDVVNKVLGLFTRTSGNQVNFRAISVLQASAGVTQSKVLSITTGSGTVNVPPTNIEFIVENSSTTGAANNYFAISIVDPSDGRNKIIHWRFVGTAPFIIDASAPGPFDLTATQVRMYVSGAMEGTQLDSTEMILSARHETGAPPGQPFERRILARPIFWEVAANAFRGDFFDGLPFSFFSADSPKATAISRCMGFNGNVNEILTISATKLISNQLAACRWKGTGTFDVRNALTVVDAASAYCAPPQVPTDPRADTLTLSISNDGFHFGPDVFTYPIFDPRVNITDLAIRSVRSYYYLDLGMPATITLSMSSPDGTATFSPSTLVFNNVRRLESPSMYAIFSRTGVVTIKGTATKCSGNVIVPTGDIPSFSLSIVVKEFVGLDLPATIVNNLDVKVSAYLGSLPPGAPVPYTVNFDVAVTQGVGSTSTGPLVYRGQSLQTFTLKGLALGPLELTLVPSGQDAAQFATMKFLTNIVGVNVTFTPDNVRLNTPTTITATISRKLSILCNVALSGVTGTITDTIRWVNSDVATFVLTASAYGVARITLTPVAGAESPDFAQFSAITRDVVVAEVFSTVFPCPRKSRTTPNVVTVLASTPVTVDVGVTIVTSSAKVTFLNSNNFMSFANSNSSSFTLENVPAGLLTYRLTPVAGIDSSRFAARDFTCLVERVKLSLDIGTTLLQNESTEIRASLDLRSNVTFALNSTSPNMTLTKTTVDYPNEETDKFRAQSAVFGPVTLTFTPLANSTHFADVETQTFRIVVVGGVRSNLAAQVFTGEQIPIIFTVSGNAFITFKISGTTGTTFSPDTISFANAVNTTNGTYTAPIVATFGGTGLQSLTLTPVSGADLAHFSPTVFTTNSAPNPTVACAIGLTLCKDKVSCRANLADCPTTPVCPLERPFQCEDGQCALYASDCAAIALPACPNGGVRCPDFTCAAFINNCPTQITCSASAPVKCYDGTCRRAARDCAKPVSCPPGQFSCPSGVCRASPEQCPAGAICAQGLTLCPDLTCKASASQCAVIADLPICPPGRPTACLDGSCIVAGATCPAVQCPASSSTFCLSGECAAGNARCLLENGCPFDKPAKCKDGTCGNADGSGCPANPASCPPSASFSCPDGSCAPAQQFCPAASGCPAATPRLCADRVNCVGKDAQCPPRDVCDARAPFRCNDGLCVTTLSLCLETRSSPICPDPNLSVPCADGTCQASSAQCTTIKACPSNRPFRCQNGECRASSAACPLTVRGLCSSQQAPFQCPNGECAAEFSQCSTSNGCTEGNPTKCPDGTCVARSATCAAVAPANGCPRGSPIKCPNGACEADATRCLNVRGCPLSLPTRCGDGSCNKDAAACASRASTCGSRVKCPDGSCAARFQECTGEGGCPLSAPYRCADGTCKVLPFFDPVRPEAGCLSGNTCADPTPFKCSDGSCVMTSAECKPVRSCPVNLPFRCPNTLACAESAAACPSFRCPRGTPVYCMDTGACVLDATMCLQPRCPSATPYRCAWGECVNLPSECTKKTSCTSPEFPVQCPDGACRSSLSDCAQLNSCPASLPYRCLNGACVNNKVECPTSRRALDSGEQADASTRDFQALQTTDASGCAVGLQRCADGVCRTRAQCPEFRGCAFPLPYMCPTGLCAADSSGCTGGTCGAGEFKCSDNTCQRVASLCPPLPVPSVGGIIVTHDPTITTTYEITTSAGVEFYTTVTSGSIKTTDDLVVFVIKRRTQLEIAPQPWKPEVNLQSGIFDIDSYLPGPSEGSVAQQSTLRAPVVVGFGGGGRLTGLIKDVCISQLNEGLTQLTECSTTNMFIDRSVYVATNALALAPYGAVRSDSPFGDSSSILNPTTLPTDGAKKLNGGEIAGIVIGIILFLLLLLAILLICLNRKRQRVAASKADAAERVAKQAAEVELVEDEFPSEKAGKGVQAEQAKAAVAALTASAPLSVPVLAPKPKVKTLDTLPPLVTSKKPPQAVVPYRPSLPTLFAADTSAKGGSAPLVDPRGPKSVDLATLHRTATEGLERSGAEDERPNFSTSRAKSNLSRAETPTDANNLPNQDNSGSTRKRLFDVKPRLGGGGGGGGNNGMGAGAPMAMPSLPQEVNRDGTGGQGGVEDQPPPQFSTTAGHSIVAGERGQINEDDFERLPGSIASKK